MREVRKFHFNNHNEYTLLLIRDFVKQINAWGIFILQFQWLFACIESAFWFITLSVAEYGNEFIAEY